MDAESKAIMEMYLSSEMEQVMNREHPSKVLDMDMDMEDYRMIFMGAGCYQEDFTLTIDRSKYRKYMGIERVSVLTEADRISGRRVYGTLYTPARMLALLWNIAAADAHTSGRQFSYLSGQSVYYW